MGHFTGTFSPASIVSKGTDTPQTILTVLDHMHVVTELDWSKVQPIATVASDGNYAANRAKAVAQCNAKVRDMRMNMGENLGELKRTISMIDDAVDRIMRACSNAASAARAARRGNKKQAKSAWKRACSAFAGSPPSGFKPGNSAANNWLALRYGWGPLLNEMYGAMTFCFDGIKSAKVVKRFSAHSSPWTVVQTSTSGQYGYNASTRTVGATGLIFNMDWKYTHKDTMVRSVEIGYFIRYDNPVLSSAMALGLDNPALTAWELTTLSFVWDWFINVSDCLEQFSSFTGVTFVKGWETITTNTTRDTTCFWYSPPPSNVSVQLPKASGNKHEVERIVLTTPPTFGLHLYNGLNTRRLLDAAALGRQLIRT
jgi:hypothetical protein